MHVSGMSVVAWFLAIEVRDDVHGGTRQNITINGQSPHSLFPSAQTGTISNIDNDLATWSLAAPISWKS